MDSLPGRRALAKRDTRRTIRRAALELFHERGFDAVTTTQVADAAGVAPATLFNYFATKEDLFFGQVAQMERELVELVRACPPGGSILAALKGHVIYELTAGRADTDPAGIEPFHHQIGLSSRLQARESEIYQRREAVLAAALVDCGVAPLTARVAAGSYVAAQKIVAVELRERLARLPARRVLREIRPFIDEVFARLSGGLGELPAPVRPSET